MRLEDTVLQTRDIGRSALFWEGALGLTRGILTDHTYEGRLALDPAQPDLWLDVCLEQVDRAPDPHPRLHPDLLGGPRQQEVVERLIELGARPLDIGQKDVPWVVLADPDGSPLCVMEERTAYQDTGAIAALPLDSADPERDGELYAALTGWVPVAGSAPVTLRHPSLHGPLLELWAERGRKQTQNRMHLDVRPESSDPGQEEAVELALSLGATRVDDDWAQGHAWVVLRDASGNEFCVLGQESP
ncbi:VOC family protein [Ornithinimicrobium panacihumi]|uniref:VOC family protein n=1 Tax=Ornithinimicrobium panacihumi TaxID=2008449 RepID=UPI003F88ED05